MSAAKIIPSNPAEFNRLFAINAMAKGMIALAKRLAINAKYEDKTMLMAPVVR